MITSFNKYLQIIEAEQSSPNWADALRNAKNASVTPSGYTSGNRFASNLIPIQTNDPSLNDYRAWNPDSLYFSSSLKSEATTFGISKEGEIFYSNSEDHTHTSLVKTSLQSMWNVAKGVDSLKHLLQYKAGDDLLKVLELEGIHLYPSISEKQLIKMLRFFEIQHMNGSIPEYWNYKRIFEVSGRFAPPIITFWDNSIRVQKYLPLLFSFLKYVGLNPENMFWKFSNAVLPLTYSQLQLPINKGNIASAEEQIRQELIRQQHINPLAKAELGKAGAGSLAYGRRALAAGFPHAASFNQYFNKESFEI